MDKLTLKGKKRTEVGRKVKNLRKQGLLPANLYGNKIKSQAVEVLLKDFQYVYSKAGESKIVNLSFAQGEPHPILIHNVQIDYRSRLPLHADFYQVNLKEKVKTKVPVVLQGESPAVIQKIGLLLQTLNEVEVEALPADLPEKLIVDISALTALDQEVKVADLKLLPGVTLLSDSKLVIVKVSELVSKETEKLAKEEEEAAAAAKAASAIEAPAETQTIASETTSKAETKTEAPQPKS